jgi:hypothetical protein
MYSNEQYLHLTLILLLYYKVVVATKRNPTT